MGVPAFFRWLSRKYPAIIVNANEERPGEINGVKVPVDATKPNPNYQVRVVWLFTVITIFRNSIISTWI
jgi:5'-3' exonuclease